MGHVCCMGMIMGLCLVFYVFFCKPVDVHTLSFETATWNPRSSPTCDLCEADDDVQDEQCAIFHCTHPHTVSLCRRYVSLFSEQPSSCTL